MYIMYIVYIVYIYTHMHNMTITPPLDPAESHAPPNLSQLCCFRAPCLQRSFRLTVLKMANV